jgi:hypothetical protein
MSKDIKGNRTAIAKRPHSKLVYMEGNMNKTKFIRAGQFNELSIQEQHAMAKEMVKAWTQAKADIEAEAIEAGYAYYDPQDFNVKAKAAYVQTRNMFRWK